MGAEVVAAGGAEALPAAAAGAQSGPRRGRRGDGGKARDEPQRYKHPAIPSGPQAWDRLVEVAEAQAATEAGHVERADRPVPLGRAGVVAELRAVHELR